MSGASGLRVNKMMNAKWVTANEADKSGEMNMNVDSKSILK